MYLIALVLVAIAGIAFCLAAAMRWRLLRRADADPQGWLWPMWLGLGLLSAGLVCSLFEPAHTGFTYALLGAWAAVASLFFLARFLALPSRGLLALPIGGMILLVVMASMAGRAGDHVRPGEDGLSWLSLLHILFMASHTAAVLLAAAASGIWLLARRQLKSAAPSALKLPSLPLLERLLEVGLVLAAALLIGGLATGGAAIQQSQRFTLLHGTPMLGLLSMALLVVLLGLRAAHNLNRRSMAIGSLVVFAVTVLSIVSLLVSPPHGH